MNTRALQDKAQDSIAMLTTERMEAEINIIEWGRWSRGGIPTGKVATGTTPAISDDEALRIDRQVAQLPAKVKEIIIQMYVCERGVNELARILKSNNRQVMALRDQGLGILYGALCLDKD